MNGRPRAVRVPVVVSLTQGGGASTLAAALHADDGGLLEPGTAGEADILLCQEPAVRQAAALACAPTGPRPVLALVTAPGVAAGTPPPVLARRFAAVVELPHIGHWAATADVRREAATVLALPVLDLPPPVRRYAAALHRLVAALTESGLLERTSAPLVSRPSTGTLWRGLRPVQLPGLAAPIRPVPVPVPLGVWSEPDDEAIEAEPMPVTAGRTG